MKSTLRSEDKVRLVCPSCGHEFDEKYGKLQASEKHNCPHCKLHIKIDIVSKAIAETIKMTQETDKLLSTQNKSHKV